MPALKYRFGPFLLRMRTRELFRDEIKLKLRPQAFHVLAVLLERSGDCVTREELEERVWSGNQLVDAEHGLNTAIKELRASLSDSASNPRYVETLPKLGYRVIVPVDVIADEPVERMTGAAANPEGPVPDRRVPEATTAFGAARRLAVSLVVGAAVIVALLVLLKSPLSRRRHIQQVSPNDTRVMLAVLPSKI